MKIKLTEEQQNLLQDHCEVMDELNFAQDYSEMGAGKSVIALALYKHLQEKYGVDKMLVITANRMMTEQLFKEIKKYATVVRELPSRQKLHVNEKGSFSVQLLGIHPYTATRGVSREDWQVTTCGILKRKDIKKFNKDGSCKVDRKGEPLLFPQFKIRASYREYFDDKTFVWFDESQELRNRDTATYLACREIYRTVQATDGYIHMTSATPYSKSEHVYNFLLFMDWFNPQWKTGYYQDQKIFIIAKHYDSAATDAMTVEMGDKPSKKNLKTFVTELYQKVVFPKISHCIYTKPLNVKSHARDLLITVDQDIMDEYRRLLERLAAYAHEKGKEPPPVALQMALQNIKVIPATRFVRAMLTAEKNFKMIIYFSFTEVGQKLLDNLSEFNPLYIDGGIVQEYRSSILEAFNREDDTHRLLICNSRTVNAGSNLHDVSEGGKFPRGMFIFPDFHYLNMVQSSGRTYRHGATSDSYIFMGYLVEEGTTGDPSEHLFERDLYQIVMKRAAFLKSVIDKDSKSSSKLVGTFEPRIVSEPFSPEQVK